VATERRGYSSKIGFVGSKIKSAGSKIGLWASKTRLRRSDAKKVTCDV